MKKIDYKALYEQTMKLNESYDEIYHKLLSELNNRFIEYEKLYIHNKSVQLENERLNKANRVLEENWKHYMSKCGKAIEYIKDNITWYYDEDLDQSVYQDEVSGDKILNILQNGSDDNE